MAAALSLDAVIFDLDGVLADTEPAYQAAFAASLAKFGRVCPESVYGRLVGLATPDRAAVLESAFPDLPVTDVLDAYAALKAALLAHGATPRHGAGGLLSRLKAAGVPVAVATSASRATVERVLDGIGLRIGVVATRDDCLWGKPHPAVYLHAARLLGVAPARCIAVEDTAVGAEAALACARCW